MTPRELAIKILSRYEAIEPCEATEKELQVLTSLLSSALEEAHKEGFEFCNVEIPGIEKEAKADAYEECAKIVEEFPIPKGFHEVLEIHDKSLKGLIAEQIRQLKENLK